MSDESNRQIVSGIHAFLSEGGNLGRLTPGRTSLAGTVEIHGREVFLKVLTEPRRLVRWENHYLWLRRIASVDPALVPQVLAFVKPLHPKAVAALALEPIRGRPLSALWTQPQGEALRRGYGALLRRMHSLPLSEPGVVFDGETWPTWPAFVVGSMEKYVDDIARLGGELPVALKDAAIAAVVSSRDSYPEGPLAPVHGDPSVSNVLIDERGRWLLVDFELSHYGDAMMDLAIARLFDLGTGDADWSPFLSGYGALSGEEIRRIKLYQIVRLLRLMRGKLWIYRDQRAFETHVTELDALLSDFARRPCQLLA